MKEARQKRSEITEEEEDDETFRTLDPNIQKERIKQIIQYQKSLYCSSSFSSSFISAAASTSSISSSSRRNSLLDLMKGGSTSLRRLFAMEHICLSTHFNEFSGSPVIKPIYLWGSDEDEGIHRLSPWRNISKFQLPRDDSELGGHGGVLDSLARGGGSCLARGKRGRHKLARTKSFRRLPAGLGFWRFRGLRLRLRRLRIMICGRKF